MKGIGKNDYTFLRPEMRVEYKWLVPPFGESDFDLRAGTIIGTVPYPLLKVHEGNGTYALHRHVFACMNPYEFASDTCISGVCITISTAFTCWETACR